MEPSASAAPVSRARHDRDSAAWLDALRADGARREAATRELHDLLLRAARFEISRRRAMFPHLRGNDLDDLAHQSADDALVAVLSKLDEYRGDSRFTTWAYKFALLEAAVKVRKRGWQGREIPIEPEHWAVIPGPGSPAASAETSEVLQELKRGLDTELSPHQREVLLAVAVNDVPIDVLAERLNTTRGALYKTVHDARKKLRGHLDAVGYGVGERRGDQDE